MRIRQYRMMLGVLIALFFLGFHKGWALDIPKGTFYFDNSLTQYPHVKFVYGSDSPGMTYVVSMTDAGNNRWAITIPETVTNMYRYVFTETSMADGIYEQTFTEVKDYISLTLDERRTITSDVPIPVGWIYPPTNHDKWASAEWRQPEGKEFSGTLPVMFIQTETPVDSKEEYVKGTCYIDPMGIEGCDSLGSAEEPVALKIKGHGNWTWTSFSKKPYRLKFDEKEKPLGMKKNRHFVLMACADDNLGFLRNAVGFELSRQLQLAYTPQMEPVEVVLNGNYIGLYMLADKIRVAKKRVNIEEQADMETHPDSITGGWLIEIDNYSEEGQVVFREGNTSEYLMFSMHSPEVLSTEQRSYITTLLKNTDKAIYASDKSSTEWEKYIDMDSLARFYIVQEVMDNGESFHGSCYIHKHRGNDTKLIFGPVWDFGNAFQRGFDNFIDVSQFHQFWIGEIARYPRFQEQVVKLWQPFLADRYPNVLKFVDSFIEKIAAASRCDARRWSQYGYGTSDIEGRKNDFLYRMKEKVAFLREHWGEGVSGIAERRKSAGGQSWFTLDGQRLTIQPSKPGIYVHGGRKVVVR